MKVNCLIGIFVHVLIVSAICIESSIAGAGAEEEYRDADPADFNNQGNQGQRQQRTAEADAYWAESKRTDRDEMNVSFPINNGDIYASECTTGYCTFSPEECDSNDDDSSTAGDAGVTFVKFLEVSTTLQDPGFAPDLAQPESESTENQREVESDMEKAINCKREREYLCFLAICVCLVLRSFARRGNWKIFFMPV